MKMYLKWDCKNSAERNEGVRIQRTPYLTVRAMRAVGNLFRS